MKSSKMIAFLIVGAACFCSFGAMTMSVGDAKCSDVSEVQTSDGEKKHRLMIADASNEEVQRSTEATASKTETQTVTTMTMAMPVTSSVTTFLTKQEVKIPTVSAGDVRVEAVSVSCLKVTWEGEENRTYDVRIESDAPYQENAYYVFGETGECYITGLRENSEYKVYVTPVLEDGEETEKTVISRAAIGHTQAVEVIQEFDREEGWTGCFAGERASGLTAMPSSGAIHGSFADTITGTGIRRFDNGDYACAMGTHYGYCNDRFLIELDNGIQFTVRICDSKGCGDVQDEYGGGMYHWFGGEGNGKCIIEFIYDDASIPSVLWTYGSWGVCNWNGLNLCSDITSIRKINY